MIVPDTIVIDGGKVFVSDTFTRACARPPGLLHPAAAKVIATLSNEWDGLARHQDLPQLPLDNNTAERALRTPVIGRKNFYGSGAEWAAHLAADVYTSPPPPACTTSSPSAC